MSLEPKLLLSPGICPKLSKGISDIISLPPLLSIHALLESCLCSLIDCLYYSGRLRRIGRIEEVEVAIVEAQETGLLARIIGEETQARSVLEGLLGASLSSV